MANPLLSTLTPAPETRVFRAIQAVLAADLTLLSVALKIRAWEGDVLMVGEPLDLVPPAPTDLPLLTLAPASNPARWETESQHRGVFAIDCTLYVAGTHADDLLNLWHAVRLAILPQDPTQRAAVAARFAPIGEVLPRPEFIRQPASIVTIGEARYATKSIGTINIVLYVNT